MRFRFTDAKVKADNLLPPPGRDQVDHSDEVTQGLRLRVSRSGGRSYRLELWRGVDAQGRRGREIMVIGNARHMTVAEARQKAAEALRRRETEGEALGVQRALRDRERANQAASTFEKAWQRFMSEHVEGGEAPLRPRTAQGMRHAYKRVEHWAPVPLTKIRDVDILAVLSGMKAERKLAMARLQRAYLSSFFNWALAERLIKVSPVPAMPRRRRTAERKEAGTILTVAQLRVILEAARSLRDRRHSVFVETLTLCGTRRQETAFMHVDHVDLDAGTWTIPASIAKNGRQHIVFLAPQLVDALRELAPDTAGYFFGTEANGFSNYSRLKAELDQLMSREPPDFAQWSWHDLRRSMASGLGDLGIAPHVIESLLNHKTGETRTTLGSLYNRSRYDADAMQAWGVWARRVLDESASNVVQLSQENRQNRGHSA